MDNAEQLRSLVGSLEKIIDVLCLDPCCQWRSHFESSLQEARDLVASGFTQDQLGRLSSSVMHVYGGTGSFADYAPVLWDCKTGRCSIISGAEDFEKISRRVYDAALSLRVIGEVADPDGQRTRRGM